tara:strand:+ start:26815 stop:31980 length:5166 start_codon:yes stop_codon:yes gene_type:complete
MMDKKVKCTKVAPTKVTAGSGTYYETDVVAACLIELLREERFENASGSIMTGVSVQKQDDLWRLDDVLLEYQDSLGSQILVPTSIKSFSLFAKTNERREFVLHGWTDMYSIDRRPRPFSIGCDFLGLFANFGGSIHLQQINTLLGKARQQRDDFCHRIVESGNFENAERWLEWLAKPDGLNGGVSDDDKSRQAFIAALHVRDFDFGAKSSTSLQRCLNDCRLLTVEQSPIEGERLWMELWRIARQVRETGGDLNRSKLLDELDVKIQLKQSPRFERFYRILQERSDEDLAAQPRMIGGKLHLTRIGAVKSLDSQLDSSDDDPLVVIGESGVGKSTIVADVLERRALWRPLFFRVDTAINLVEESPDLFQPFDLREVLEGNSCPRSMLVVDGVEQVATQSQIRSLAKFLRAGTEGRRWRVVITCQREHFPRITQVLSDLNLDISTWHKVPIGDITYDDIEVVVKAFPSLRRVLLQPKLPTLYLRPVIVDALIRAASERELESMSAVGESDLIHWIWEHRIAGTCGTNVSNLLLELARQQADQGELETSELSLSGYSDAIDKALKASLLTRRRGKLRFTHDLYADWARMLWLRASGREQPQNLVKRSIEPRWHRAIRTFAVDLLEQNESVSEWQDHITKQSGASDLFLDGLLFAADPAKLLTKVRSILLEDRAALAKRLARRAMVVCTGPGLLEIRKRMKGEPVSAFVRTYKRDPKPFYDSLGPLIDFFASTMDAVVECLPLEVLALSHLWLERTGDEWPSRKPAAEISLTISESILESGRRWYRGDEVIAEQAFKSAFYAYEVLPDRATKCFIEAAGLNPNSNRIRKDDEFEDDFTEAQDDICQTEKHWPGGPLYRPNEGFRKACFNADAMLPLFFRDPELARRLIYAISINVRAGDVELEQDFPGGVGPNENGFEPFFFCIGARHYLEGPYRHFLQVSPRVASRLIVDLANFASANNAASIERTPGSNRVTRVQSPVSSENWLGDEHGFFWNRGYGSAFDQLIPALSALEKHLGDEIENGTEVNELVGEILSECRSLAIAGVLIDVGRRHPRLFDGVLRPLLSVPILLFWCETVALNPNQPRLWGPSLDYGEGFFDEHKAWLIADYRQLSLLQVSKKHFSTDKLLWDDPSAENLNALSAHDNNDFYDRIQELATDRTVGDPTLQTLMSTKENIEEPKTLPRELAEAVYLARTLNSALRNGDWLTVESLQKFARTVFDGPDTSEVEFVNEISENNRFGLLLLLLLRHRDWLVQEGTADCAESLYFELLRRPLPKVNDELSNAGAMPTFATAVVQVSIGFLARNDDHIPTRKFVAEQIMDGDMSLLKGATQIIWENWSALGPWGPRSIRLMLETASARWHVTPDPFKHTSKSPLDYKQWRNDRLIEFVDGEFPDTVPNLSDCLLTEPRIRWANWRRGHSRDEENYFMLLPIEETVVEAVLAGTPLLSSAKDGKEREARFGVIQCMLEIQLSYTKTCSKDGRPLEVQNEKYPQFIGQKLIVERLINELKDAVSAADARAFWKPIIELGTQSPHWVETFMARWLGPIIAQPSVGSDYVATWKEILDFASGSEAWEEKEKNKDFEFRRTELVAKLLLIDESYFSMWDDSHAPYVKQAKKSIAPLLADVIGDPFTAWPALRWIGSEVGKCFLPDALEWMMSISEFCKTAPPQSKIVAAFANALDVAYQDHQELLTGDYRKLFFDLVSKAAYSGNPMAIELQQRIADL